MTIKQISVFLENKEGRLKEVLKVLADNDINIISMYLADTAEYGMLRLVVSHPEKAKDVLKNNHMMAELVDVLAIRVPHATGSLYKIMQALVDAGQNVEYMYAFANGEDASFIFKTKKPVEAIAVAKELGFSMWTAKEVYHVQ